MKKYVVTWTFMRNTKGHREYKIHSAIITAADDSGAYDDMDSCDAVQNLYGNGYLAKQKTLIIISDDSIYGAALNHYGEESQQDKLIEEMAELTQALLKFRRNDSLSNFQNLNEEFADVMIVMSQMNLLMDQKLLESYKQKKLSRLQGLLKLGDNDINKYANDIQQKNN